VNAISEFGQLPKQVFAIWQNFSLVITLSARFKSYNNLEFLDFIGSSFVGISSAFSEKDRCQVVDAWSFRMLPGELSMR
jgi:hypothetical protein